MLSIAILLPFCALPKNGGLHCLLFYKIALLTIAGIWLKTVDGHRLRSCKRTAHYINCLFISKKIMV
uniref:Secreted protein n=1 Tax=Heterorhabditis bacteriophora TaxID=37862 RepID=A0A1I7WU09_HETBA